MEYPSRLADIDVLQEKIKGHRSLGAEELRQLKEYYRIDSEQAGRYRNRNVIITGTDYLPPTPAEIPGYMAAFFADVPALRQQHPVVYAALLHLKLVTIHPFVDGNGRTARLLMNLVLLRSGYPITIIPPALRGDYTAALRESNRGHDELFVNFMTCCVWESQREYLRLLTGLDRK